MAEGRAKRTKQLDDQLNEALKDSFPASDPVSVGESSKHPTGSADRGPAPIDHNRVRELAKKLDERRAAKNDKR